VGTVLRFAIKVVIMAGVFYLVTQVLAGVQVIGNPDAPLGEAGTFLWIALIFGLVNAVVGPILRLLSLPFVLLTLGLFLLVINALMLLLTGWLAEQLDLGFRVDGFWSAVGGAIIVTITTWIVDALIGAGGDRP
jgi:putative membrane protein